MRAGKNDFAEVGVYAIVVALLLGWRLVQRLRRAVRDRNNRARAGAAAPMSTEQDA